MFGFGGGGPPEKEENELYEILGVPRTATQQQIKTAFRKAAMQHHPDKGGDVEQYKKINTANEILSDPEKRALYDKYGMEGLRDGGGRGGGGPADIFDLFGMGGGRRGGGGPQGKRKGEDVVFPLKVTLDELYTGTEKKLRLTKNIICAACNGAGGKGEPKPCAPCKGRGMRIIIRQIGPGMIQQMQTVCDACSGTGQTIDPKDRCTTCEGAKTVKEKKTLTVYVNRGQRHGERIVFRGEADEAPDTVPGNVVVVLQQKEHDVFTRRGEDLIVRHTISLSEALCGFSFQLKHLDERVLVVKSAPGAIYKPGDVKNIPNEGMPSSKNQFNRGNLYIEFNVEFPKPEELTPETVAQLARLLPPGPNNVSTTMLPDEHEVVGLVDVNLDDLRRSEEEAQQRAQQEAYDEDEEGGGHPQGGCRQG